MIQDWEICVELNLDAFRREKRANREKIERADHGSRKFLFRQQLLLSINEGGEGFGFA